VVDAAWRRLLDRAGPRALPPLTDDPDLHLLVDGTRVDAEERQRSVYVFRLPPSPKRVVIASREIVPAEFEIARDPRSLGVALRQLAVRQGVEFILLDADDERLTAGFHAYEPSDNLRWTDGSAKLPSAAFARFDKGAELTLHLGGATQYPDEQARPARPAALGQRWGLVGHSPAVPWTHHRVRQLATGPWCLGWCALLLMAGHHLAMGLVLGALCAADEADGFG
jgi:hypothetical protein